MTMEYKDILYSKEDGVATITMNRPHRMNAYTDRMIQEMINAIDDVREDNDVKVMVLTGTGKGFCSGGDLFDTGPPTSKTPGVEAPALSGAAWAREGPPKLYLRLRWLPKPAIAAVNGTAVAEGVTMALLCDFSIVSDRARFGLGIAGVGTNPDIGMLQLLPRYVGMGRALAFTLSDELISAEQAERIGLVTRVVPHDELEKVTRELATKLARGPAIALQMSKGALWKLSGIDVESSSEYSALMEQIASTTEDCAEGLRAFKEKRPPVFKGK
jgi:2-(1,2-epoxy-1,2-dihydrophenyl)acetyl-CoA isomerase